MRTAHLFVVSGMLATGLISGCGTIGGNGGGVVGFDTTQGNLQFLQPTAVTVSPKNSTRSVTQTVQLSVQAQLPNTGQIVEATRFATFLSANPAIATVDGSGLVTAVAPGTTTVNATINGVTDVANITVPPLVNRLFVSNTNGDSVTVYDPSISGNQTPLRTFAGNSTLLNSPRQVAVSGQQLLVANETGNSVTVYSLHANGDIAPLRTIAGTNTTLNRPRGLAVFNNEIFVSCAGTNTINVFPLAAAGNVTPTRTIGGLGALNTQIDLPSDLSVANGEITLVSSNNSRIIGFPVAATGDVAPTLRNLTSAAMIRPLGLSLTAADLITSTPDTNTTLAFAPGATGVTAPLRTIPGTATTGLSGPTGLFVSGAELFIANFQGNNTAVFPVGTNADVPPTRLITGGMNSPYGLVIAPSI